MNHQAIERQADQAFIDFIREKRHRQNFKPDLETWHHAWRAAIKHYGLSADRTNGAGIGPDSGGQVHASE